MEIIRLTKNYPCYSNLFVSFVIKLPNIKDIWIFNCHEACQPVSYTHLTLPTTSRV